MSFALVGCGNPGDGVIYVTPFFCHQITTDMSSKFIGYVRVLIYAIIMSFVIPLVYCAFNWVCIQGIILFFELQDKMYWLIFWILFFGIGLTIVVFVRFVFTFISTIIVNLFSKVCPIWYWRFSTNYTRVICTITVLIVMYGYLNGNNQHDFKDIAFGFVLLWANYSLGRDLVTALKAFHKLEIEEIYK